MFNHWSIEQITKCHKRHLVSAVEISIFPFTLEISVHGFAKYKNCPHGADSRQDGPDSSIHESGAGLLPLTLGTPLVSVLHPVHFPAFPDLAARFLVEPRGFGGDRV